MRHTTVQRFRPRAAPAPANPTFAPAVRSFAAEPAGTHVAAPAQGPHAASRGHDFSRISVTRPGGERKNETGLPDALKQGVESLSGMSLDGVKVHYNSPRPARVQAAAYTQGTAIHVAPGQERHLPHEAWHVVQQMRQRVKPTLQVAGTHVNDDVRLEAEADAMGAKALQAGRLTAPPPPATDVAAAPSMGPAAGVVQCNGGGKKKGFFANLQDSYKAMVGSKIGPMPEGARSRLAAAVDEHDQPRPFTSAVGWVNRGMGNNTDAELDDRKADMYMEDIKKVQSGEMSSMAAFGRSAKGWYDRGNYPAAVMNFGGAVGSAMYEGMEEDRKRKTGRL